MTTDHDTIIDGFTKAEQQASATYAESVHNSGLHACFDAFDADHLRWHDRELGNLVPTKTMVREHAEMLTTWHEALDTLLGDMLTCTTETTSYSRAAREFIQAAADDYHQTRATFEHAVTLWALDLTTMSHGPAGHPAPYPEPTRAVNFLTQSLTND